MKVILASVFFCILTVWGIDWAIGCTASTTDESCRRTCSVSVPLGGSHTCSGSACKATCKSWTASGALYQTDETECVSGCPTSGGGGGSDDPNDDGGSFDCYPFSLDCYPDL